MARIPVTEEYSVTVVDDGSIRNVMIVDDEKDIYEILAIFLDKWGYNPVVARNTEEGIKIFSAMEEEGIQPKELLDLILLDIKMPLGMMDGLEFHDYLKSRFDYHKIIFMTGLLSEETTEKEIKKREKYCFEKPFDVNEMKKVIDGYLGESDQE